MNLLENLGFLGVVRPKAHRDLHQSMKVNNAPLSREKKITTRWLLALFMASSDVGLSAMCVVF